MPYLSLENRAPLWFTSQWTSVLYSLCGSPAMGYGMDSVSLSRSDLSQLVSAQGCIIKKAMGFPKRSHHSQLLTALQIPSMEHIIVKNTASLFHQIFQVSSPAQLIQSSLLSRFLLYDHLTPNSLLDRLIAANISPVDLIFISLPSLPAALMIMEYVIHSGISSCMLISSSHARMSIF